MSQVARVGVIAAGVVVMLLGMSGRLLPHQWFGVSTADLIGLLILASPAAVLFVFGMIFHDRLKQLRRGQAYMNRRLDDLAAPRRKRRGEVVQGPWSGSGGSE